MTNISILDTLDNIHSRNSQNKITLKILLIHKEIIFI